MTKTFAQIDLVWVDDESQSLCVHAILFDGKLASEKMYCHLREWNGQEDEIYPGLLVDQDGKRCMYSAEWGFDQKWIDFFVFLDQPLAVGQSVSRTLVLSTPDTLTYRITAIIQLLT
ncbi:hypothetical protein EI969_08095 [Pseudomonas sp. PB101]|uniref:hypothetical protein n=1 Tax=Pseudomonas sp. PB101 TaxID=2495428 RepID=UPI00136581F1|nr:hypothetical protein [Pseudomonas sp. PB101]MVW85902.1 hypothetical protein [Pseudomonas sp. PB101]